MIHEIIGFAKYLLILITIGSALERQWIAFVVLFVLVMAVFYAQEYNKMYKNKVVADNGQDHITFGIWTLGDELDYAYDDNLYAIINGKNIPIKKIVRKIEGVKLNEFLNTGARLEYRDENIYESKLNTLSGIKGWSTIISTHKGVIYKIGMSYTVDVKHRNDVLVEVSNEFYKRFSKSDIDPRNSNKFTYVSPQSKVIMKIIDWPGNKVVQFNVIARLI